MVAYQHSATEDSNATIGTRVSQVIGADHVAYNDTANLAKAIGISEEERCFTCSTGNYAPLGIRPTFKSRIQMKGE